MRTFELGDSDDESIRALSLILAAWDEGTETGVAPELMAYAALFTALTDLVALFGESAVAKMAKGLERRVELGELRSTGRVSNSKLRLNFPGQDVRTLDGPKFSGDADARLMPRARPAISATSSTPKNTSRMPAVLLMNLSWRWPMRWRKRPISSG